MTGVPLVVAFGGGVNSAAMLIGMQERGIRPDLVMFSDTGGEKPETYAFIETASQWLQAHGLPEIITVRASQKTDPTLEANCLRIGCLPSIAYGFKSCSQRWKMEPQEKFLNSWGPARESWAAGGKVRQAVGIDAGEPQRVRESPNEKKLEVWYPLVEWGWARKQCVDAIKRSSLPVPPKSACFFCPSSKKSEVLWLKKNHPALFDRAVAMEHASVGYNDAVKGLGRHWSWEGIAAADEQQFKLFTETVPVPCMCFDGEGDEGEE